MDIGNIVRETLKIDFESGHLRIYKQRCATAN